jgi:DNA-binding NarL/FixJ family response regulator
MPNVFQPLNVDATTEPPSPAMDGPADQYNSLQDRTILIVDDSHFERSVIRSAVEALTKFRVCGEASDGAEAIKKARELRPDLVIMDLAMPLMNGVEAAMVLRNTMPKVPVVLFTLYAEQLRGAISPGFGVTQIVSKTAGLAGLIESLERLLAA